jgi:hypothetical protein
MSIPTGAILRVVLSWIMPDSVIAQNIFFALFDNDGGSNDDADVVDDLTDWMEDIFSSMITSISDQVDMSIIKVYIYDSVDQDWDEVGTGVPVFTATGSTDMSPHGVAGIIHAFTVNPDVTGTKFIAGIADASIVDSDISGAVIANLLLAGADWMVDFTGAASGSNFNPGVWSPTKVQFFEFQDKLVVNSQVAYQRRRKPGVGI